VQGEGQGEGIERRVRWEVRETRTKERERQRSDLKSQGLVIDMESPATREKERRRGLDTREGRRGKESESLLDDSIDPSREETRSPLME
jgi:hypothetical protein